MPKGRLFPLSRDELVECLATVRSLRNGELDALKIPPKPLDVLALQIVACVACEDWDEGRLFDLMCSAYPYRNLSRERPDGLTRPRHGGLTSNSPQMSSPKKASR